MGPNSVVPRPRFEPIRADSWPNRVHIPTPGESGRAAGAVVGPSAQAWESGHQLTAYGPPVEPLDGAP